METESGVLLQVSGVTKSYGGPPALRQVDLSLGRGEILAVCGENGAGKSTLNKILSGSITADSGEIRMDGKPLVIKSAADAEAAGIAIVHQESVAFLSLSATDNHQIMREPTRLGGLWLDRPEMRRRAVASLGSVGEDFDPDLPLESRSVAQRQMVAIARAVDAKCRVLILDEPTASLSARETESLFRVIQKMRGEGVSIVYVSHRLEEIFALADRVAVLRDGQLVATKPIAETSPEDLIRLMVGRDVEPSSGSLGEPTEGAVALQVKGLGRGTAFRDVSFLVRRGEIVALSGLVGAGRSEVVRAIFGIDRFDTGEILVGGQPFAGGHRRPTPGDAVKAGVALVPEDRQHEGLHLLLSLRENMNMVATPARLGVIDRREEAVVGAEFMRSLSVKAESDLAAVSTLSGGNQQKVLLAKWLATKPSVLILDEPTRGVDVGAKAQIHEIIRELAASGMAILVISSEMAEVLTLADRVLVMRQGAISGELSRAEADQARLLELSLPVANDAAPEVAVVRSRRLPAEATVAALLAAVLVGVSIANPAFMATGNLRDMLIKVSPAVIVGSVLTLVVLAREIDISVGSLMGLCAAVLGITCSPDRMGLPVPVGIALCLATGLVAGVTNGLLVAWARIPSIIVTLAMLTVLRGVTEKAMGGKWIENLPAGLRQFGTGSLAGIPIVVLVAVMSAAGAMWLAGRTRFGRQVYAIGSNPEAATLRGVKTGSVRIALFALTGLAAATAALVSATQLQVIESGFGNGFELVAVASVIVGGTSIRGGRGSVTGTILGATLLGIISTALIFLRLGESAVYWERAIQGGLILLAILVDHWQRKGRGAGAV